MLTRGIIFLKCHYNLNSFAKTRYMDDIDNDFNNNLCFIFIQLLYKVFYFFTNKIYKKISLPISFYNYYETRERNLYSFLFVHEYIFYKYIT